MASKPSSESASPALSTTASPLHVPRPQNGSTVVELEPSDELLSPLLLLASVVTSVLESTAVVSVVSSVPLLEAPVSEPPDPVLLESAPPSSAITPNSVRPHASMSSTPSPATPPPRRPTRPSLRTAESLG